MFTKRIYADYAATTPIDKKVIKAMKPYLTKYYGNPSSDYNEGLLTSNKIQDCKETILKLLKAPKNSELFFTSGATESNNWIIRQTAYYYKNQGKGNHLITSQIEHPSVLNTFKQLEKEGFKVTYLPVNKKGITDFYTLQQSITNETTLLSLMYVNNETGVIQPIELFSQFALEHNIFFHSDVTQAMAHIPLNLEKIHFDALSFSAHKFYGPKGVGALYVKNKDILTPLLFGGHQQDSFRPGTENVASIVGMTKALELLYNNMLKWNLENFRIKNLSTIFIELLSANIKHSFINTYIPEAISHTINVRFNDCSATSIVQLMNMKGVSISTGSACSTGQLEPSYVLTAMGLSDTQAHDSIRFSLGKYTTIDDIYNIIKKLKSVIKYLREEETA